MNRLLITPQEVLDRAFCSGEYLPPERISEELILAATERYIRPVTGVRLLEAMASGAHADLKSDLLLPALALGIRMLLVPELGLQVGACGLAAASGAGWRSADAQNVSRAEKSLKVRLKTLLGRLSDELERRREEIPEYDSGQNILNRCRIYGDLVQIL